MNHSDVVVIGSGFAGLMAALVSVCQKKSVTVLAYGAGSFPLNSGVVDILGYDKDHKAVASPLAALKDLPAEHPYHKIGQKTIEQAVEFFLGFTKAQGYAYTGSLDKQQWLPTPAGTLKPSCLVPESMQAQALHEKEIVLVGVKGLKDYYADIAAENLKKWLGLKQEIKTTELDTGLKDGRDLTTLDVARWMDTEKGAEECVRQLKPLGGPDKVFIMPQILGTRKLAIYEKLESSLETKIVESTGMPPSANGLRLRDLLLEALRELGVSIVENTRVEGFAAEHGKCQAVIAKGAVRARKYYADKFILATGGFYSGGIVMRDFGDAKEVVFGLPVELEEDPEKWSDADLFAEQAFAKTGVRTNDSLQPVDAKGNCIFTNVYAAGRILSGYDFCYEHSGNGVALASAYKAAMA